MQRIKPKAPAQYRQHVVDTERRLNILFNHLNNEDLIKPDTIQQLNELASHIQARQYDQAGAIFSDLMTNKTDEGSDWLVSSRGCACIQTNANFVTDWYQEVDSVQQVNPIDIFKCTATVLTTVPYCRRNGYESRISEVHAI
jgi:hypothetical protein